LFLEAKKVMAGSLRQGADDQSTMRCPAEELVVKFWQ
jgi:hypothetical protein